MSADLRDQLQKLGLVSEADVKRQEQRQVRRKKPANQRSAASAKATQLAVKSGERRSDGTLMTPVSADLPPKQRVMELVKQHGCNDKQTKLEYFFSDSAGVVRSAPANKKQQQQLAAGKLAIVRPQQNRDPYVLVPVAVAEEIAALVPERVVLLNR